MLLDMFLVWPDFNHYQIISFAGNWPIPAARGQAVGHAPGCRDLKLSILGYDSDRRSEPNTDLNSITKNIHADLGGAPGEFHHPGLGLGLGLGIGIGLGTGVVKFSGSAHEQFIYRKIPSMLASSLVHRPKDPSLLLTYF